MALPTIKDLEDELIALVAALPEFTAKSFSIFSLEDMERLVAGNTNNLPMAGVGYDGCAPQGNTVDPKGAGNPAAALVNLQYIIVLAVSYSASGQDDKKHDATTLLGQIRNKVMGHKNANTRAWRFIGERPEAEASGDGLVFYSQVWQTAVMAVGESLNQS
jgi:hypothetical protein